MEFDGLSNRVIGCAIEVHRAWGPGLLESAYEQCLAHELRQNDIQFKLQHPQPVKFNGTQLDCGYRIADRRRIDYRAEERRPTAGDS